MYNFWYEPTTDPLNPQENSCIILFYEYLYTFYDRNNVVSWMFFLSGCLHIFLWIICKILTSINFMAKFVLFNMSLRLNASVSHTQRSIIDGRVSYSSISCTISDTVDMWWSGIGMGKSAAQCQDWYCQYQYLVVTANCLPKVFEPMYVCSHECLHSCLCKCTSV